MSVYVVTCRELNIAKIGYSATPLRRVASLKTGLPVKCSLEAVIPATRRNESELHVRFDDQRKSGEWFTICDELESLIAAFLCGQPKRNRAGAITPFGEYCDANRISNSALAKAVGKHVSAVSRWRNGKSTPHLRDALKIEIATNGGFSLESWLANNNEGAAA